MSDFAESFIDGYMSFGQSGSTTSSTMIGADVFVAFWDDGGSTAKVVDYKLSNYALVTVYIMSSYEQLSVVY